MDEEKQYRQKKLKKKYGYDNLMHLGLLIHLDVDGRRKTIQAEKVDAVTITDKISLVGKGVQHVAVNIVEPITLQEVMDKAIKANGTKKFFDYSGLGIGNQPPNNCQYWCKMVLEQCGGWTETVAKFTMQDLTELAKEMPEISKRIMNAVTDAGQVANHLRGAGLEIQHVKVSKDVPFSDALKHAQSILKTKRNFKEKVLKNNYHFRNLPKTKFEPRSFKSKKINDQITLVLGKPKTA